MSSTVSGVSPGCFPAADSTPPLSGAEAVRSGARTVKNVTGFHIHRLATGSLGSLGAIVQVALKVRPLPQSRRTLVHAGPGGLELGRELLHAVPAAAAVLASPDRVELRLRLHRPPRDQAAPPAAGGAGAGLGGVCRRGVVARVVRGFRGGRGVWVSRRMLGYPASSEMKSFPLFMNFNS